MKAEEMEVEEITIGQQKKTKRRQPLNYKKGARRKVMELMMYTGCIPSKEICLLNGSENSTEEYIEKGLKRVLYLMRDEKEGVVEKKKVVGLQLYAIREMPVEKELSDLEKICPILTAKYEVLGKALWRRAKKTEAEAKRIIRNAEVAMFLDRCQVAYLPDEKPTFRNRQLANNTYYAPGEIQRSTMEEQSYNLTNSRNNGVVYSKGGVYPIYNYSHWPLVIYSNEYLIQSYLLSMNIGTEYQKAKITPLLLYENPYDLQYMLAPQTDDWNTILNGYEKAYMLPLTNEGQNIYKYMCKPDWELKFLYRYGIEPHKEESIMGNIGHGTVKVTNKKTGETSTKTVLLFAIPDIIRAKNFISHIRIANSPSEYIIGCFKFQEEILTMIAGEYAKIKVLDEELLETAIW